jgi:hypothetical protein
MGIKRAVEMAKLWDGEISSRTISRALKKIGFTRKKRLMATGNEMKPSGRLSSLSCPPYCRTQLFMLMNQGWMIDISMIMLGMNEVSASMHLHREAKVLVNTIARALCNQKLSAPFTIEGACNRTVFEMWLETSLVPTLVTGQVVVMDNATFHKGGRIQELIQSARCRLLYVLPYSPDFNLH